MSTQIFVGKVSFDTVEKNLQDLFAQFGEVTQTRIIVDQQTQKSRGFAFIEMSNDAEAKKAIETLNGKIFEGQNLIVNVARPREDAPRRQAGFQRSW